jgi:hypothetical protein
MMKLTLQTLQLWEMHSALASLGIVYAVSEAI